MIDLRTVGIHEGIKYEGIYTTMNKEGVKNAAPIGIQCKGLDKLGCRLFVGTHTLANVMETKRYVINITENSLNFVNSTVGNLDADKFTDDEDIAILKEADAYIVCEVTNIEKQDKIKDHVTSHGEAYLVDADATEIVINHPGARAMNRGIHCLIESLSNFTRIQLVPPEQQEYYVGRFNENKRIIDRVADDDTKKAMQILGENMKKIGYEVDQ